MEDLFLYNLKDVKDYFGFYHIDGDYVVPKEVYEIIKAELESTKGLLKTNAKVQAELLAENEKLKAEIEAYKQSEQEGLEIIAELKAKKDEYYLEMLEYERANSDLHQENEKLKKQNKILEESYNYQLEKRAEIGQVWFEEANKYKQCLKEIKEIASAKCPQISDEECAKNKRYGCEECYSKAILTKISEVLK